MCSGFSMLKDRKESALLNEFSRTQLLYGKDAMTRLSQSRIAVFGIGGVGGYVVEALARSGVGALDLIDDDKVCQLKGLSVFSLGY